MKEEIDNYEAKLKQYNIIKHTFKEGNDCRDHSETTEAKIN